MSITGKVINISKEEKITETFSKREIIVDDSDNPTYPNPLKIEFHKDKCSLLDNFKVGDSVTVEVNHRGREWVNPKGEKVYFNSMVGWLIKKVEEATAPEPTVEDAGDIDNLPFMLTILLLMLSLFSLPF